jgi:hypothetical protein
MPWFMAIFGTLTVDVSKDRVVVWFGPGLIRRTLPVADIRDARAVRNKWWYGWGIRLTPHGWLFNVAGLDAVELELASGRKFRIGTDEPQVLLNAIRTAMVGAGRTLPSRLETAHRVRSACTVMTFMSRNWLIIGRALVLGFIRSHLRGWRRDGLAPSLVRVPRCQWLSRPDGR